MIPAPDAWNTISNATEGSLQQTPIPVLLCAYARTNRALTLDLRNGPVDKRVLVEDGVPVECRSNLVHETLGRFLVQRGRISEEDAQRALQESAASGAQMGDVLMRMNLISSYDLFRELQQNLAHKLFETFTWEDGRFRIEAGAHGSSSALKVHVPTLVIAGIARFSPQRQVDAAASDLVGRPLGVHPDPPFAVDTLRLNPKQTRVVQLLKGRLRIDEIMAQATLPPDELMRLLLALRLLGVVAPADQLPPLPAGAPSSPPVQTTTNAAAAAVRVSIPRSNTNPFTASTNSSPPIPVPPLVAQAGAAPSVVAAPPVRTVTSPGMYGIGTPVSSMPGVGAALSDVVVRKRNDVMQAYLEHRKKDPFDLLEVPVDVGNDALRTRYVAFAERFAPWTFTCEHLAPLLDKASELFVAGARAYATLADAEQRALAVSRRKAATTPTKTRADAFAIKTDLLDASAQFRDGKQRMDAGRYTEALHFLEFAASCDPTNATYLAELAYCRYLSAPAQARRALQDLAEARRRNPDAGIAALYAGLIHVAMGDFAPAEAALKDAQRLLPQDRRVVEALRAVATKKR